MDRLAPMRSIIKVYGDDRPGWWKSYQMARLECGHDVFCKARFRTRCQKCANCEPLDPDRNATKQHGE